MDSDEREQIYLASQSPRRRQLLTQIGIRFLSLAVDVDEIRLPGEAPEDFVRRMAREKAQAGLSQALDPPLPVLGADTIVVLDGEVFGKPRDPAHARYMLERLSRRTHEVISVVSVATVERLASRLQVSRVRFAGLTGPLIEAYCRTPEPQDKAGAYAIQGFAGAFVEHLDGSFSGVMGLPLFETLALLTEAGVFSGSDHFLRGCG